MLAVHAYAFAQSMTEVEIKSLLDQSFSYYSDGRYQDALSGYQRLANQTKPQQTAAEHDIYIFSQEMSIMCYRQLKQFEQAFRLAGDVLNDDLSDKERAEIQNYYSFCGYLAALDYMSGQQFAEARDIFRRILPYADDDIKTRILLREPFSWYMEGVLCQTAQHYDSALVCFENAASGFHDLGRSSEEADALCRIGEIKRFLSEWHGAMRAYRKAESLTDNDGERMTILTEQRKLCSILGDNEALSDVSDRMERLVAETEDIKSRFVYNAFMGNQACDYQQYSMSERWYMLNEQLLPHLSQTEYHEQYLNLWRMHTLAGNWDKAIQYALLAKEVYQTGSSPENYDYYLPYKDISYIYRQQGDSLHCFQYLDTFFRAVHLLDEPRALQYFYMERAGANTDFGDYQRALDDYRTADSLLATRYPASDGNRVALLPLIAGMEHHLDNFDEAERLYGLYAEYTKQISGENSSDYVNALDYLANAEAFAGHMDAATHDFAEAADLLKKQARNKWPYLTSAEREGYWALSSELLQRMTPFALKAKENQTPFTAACYDGLVLTKSFLLASEQFMFDMIKKYGTVEDSVSFSNIQVLKEKVRAWERSGQEFADSILVATSSISPMEANLAKHCRAYGNATAFMDVDYSKIKQSLGEDEVLLDFTDFVSESRGRVYAAYIVNKQQDYPLLMELFPERAIDSLNVRYPYQYYVGAYAERMFDLYWKPIEEYVPNGATVYYVPSQLLFQIAPESLPAGDGTLLGDHYHFVRLSSARELMQYNPRIEVSKEPGRTDAILYGGLQYSLDSTVMAREAQKYDIPRMLAFRGNSELARGDSLFYDLPGTKEEIEIIGRELKSARLSVLPFSGKEGTEESFLSMSGHASQLLHMATHGFYYTPDAAQKVDYLRGYTDAMSLSGLVLAGGNSAWLGHDLPDGVLGGILTAADIARMDLSGVELVVLSACHSGKGEATPEGLYGLQRAFKKAGAKTIVMSLWAESDLVAPEFMAAFYKNLTGESKWNKRDAFNKAKKAISEKYPESPSLWAGFVMLD